MNHYAARTSLVNSSADHPGYFGHCLLINFIEFVNFLITVAALQFRYMSTSCENLFSLINGDDIFTTFEAMSNVNGWMWWYSRVYLYFFVSLFIYVILSVFISVIMDTYENLKVFILLFLLNI